MGLNTDFNQSPYFDDFNETKNFHRVLFKPAVAVQARELTQLQTILQNQIERFGDNILTEGTIVEGGNFVEEKNLPYVKILDVATSTAGTEISTDTNQYINLKAVGLTNGVEGIIITTEFGLESQSPNLSTLFIRYTKYAINTSNQNITSFVPGESIQLYAADSSGNYTVPFHIVTVATTAVDSSPVGLGYGVRCGDGIIYQKGHFIRFTDDLTIVSKYSNAPDGLVVGFQTTEHIIDSNADLSLLDNANGFNNALAPGADRLQLSPTLVVKTVDEAKSDETFFAIQEYANGKVVRRRLSTQYNQIEKELERRTSEESGDYVVNRFNVSVETDTANTSNLKVVVDPGVAYVDGMRVELLNSINLSLPDANTFASVSNQDINTNYGNYVVVESVTGVFDTKTLDLVRFYRSADLVNHIGTARVRAVIKQSDGDYRLYLTDIRMNSSTYTFASVDVINSVANSGEATVVKTGGITVLKDASFSKMFFPAGKSFVKSVISDQTDFVYVTNTSTTLSSNTLTITVTSNDVFPYSVNSSLNSDELLDIIVVANSSAGPVSTGEHIAVTAAALDSTGQVLTVQLAENPGSTINVTAFYKVKRTEAEISAKSLKTVYTKIQANTNPAGVNGSWSLGLPDTYQLLGVWRGTSAVAWATLESQATADSVTNNVTESFSIEKNTSDSTYGIDRLKKKKSITIGADDKIIVKMKVFEKTAGDGHFFTVDSYPIDDTTIPLPADKIRTENVPVYRGNDGITYELRDVIDLRPYTSNTAAYATTASAATVDPSDTISFSGIVTPAPNETIETSYEYYHSRNDIIIIDKNGNFEIIQGVPSENPSFPPEPNKGMLLARISVPPFPTLSPALANSLNKPSYGVAISSNQTQRYTMKDIGAIDQRIKNIEYYTSLSLLETNAKDFAVFDATGADRFKNGIFVDNFDNLYLADVNGGEFAAALDAAVNDITPRIRQYPINLKLRSTSSAVDNAGKFVTLPYTHKALPSVSQPYATDYKNCATGFYNYTGKLYLDPPYDSGPDTERAPDVNINIDLVTPFIEFTQALSTVIPSIRTTTVSGRTTTTTTIDSRITAAASRASTEVDLGDFVRDIDFKPFMRARNVAITATGLRPNTRFYFFFDGKALDGTDSAPALLAKAKFSADDVLIKNGAWGAPIVSDANGVVLAIMRIKPESVYVGERTLTILDVDSLESADSATSSAKATYSAFNFEITKTGVSTTTRPPAFVATSRTTQTSFTVEDDNRVRDPLAQTFIIDRSLSSDTDVFVTKVDLFFARKSRSGNGIFVEIREVVNGFPSGQILPFSSVRLSAEQVNANTSIGSNALTPTTVTFEGPVALKTDTEYALVIKPEGDDPDYLVWVCKTGGIDIDTGVTVNRDSNLGVLFTSTNNRTWTPYLTEDLKFTLYAAEFSSSTGSVSLTNNDNEFFTVENINGTFTEAENVLPIKSSFANGTVAVVDESDVVTGTSTAFLTDYQVDNYIIVKNGSSYVPKRIVSIANNQYMQVSSEFEFTASGLNHYTGPVGQLDYITTEEPPRMILEGSNAKSGTGLLFEVGQTLYGETSEATADITSIDDLPISYIQPQIYRSNFSKTRTTMSAGQLWNGSSTTSKDLEFGTNFLSDDEYFIRSKSNSPTSSNFAIDLVLNNTSTTTLDTSPVIDYQVSSVIAAEYIVNAANTTNDIDGTELIGQGNAWSKYVSKVITLAEGMDAEDIRIILGAYRPTGTDIRVYAKFKSDTDIRNIDTIEWTRLNIKPETDSTSSVANRYDYREYEYQLGTTSKTAGQGAWDNAGTINYIATIDGEDVVFTNYKYFAVKIVMLANGHNVVPRIKDLRAIALS